MTKAKLGNKVKVHYTGKLNDGSVFDTSTKGEPLEFKIGEGKLITGFEHAVIDMEEGQTKSEKLPYESAYGEVRDDLILSLNRDKVPDHINPNVGDKLEINQGEGQRIPVVVKEITDESITIDANHPLAGEDLTFDIELVEVVKDKQKKKS